MYNSDSMVGGSMPTHNPNNAPNTTSNTEQLPSSIAVHHHPNHLNQAATAKKAASPLMDRSRQTSSLGKVYKQLHDTKKSSANQWLLLNKVVQNNNNNNHTLKGNKNSSMVRRLN